jgi:hypothetical protein
VHTAQGAFFNQQDMTERATPEDEIAQRIQAFYFCSLYLHFQINAAEANCIGIGFEYLSGMVIPSLLSVEAINRSLFLMGSASFLFPALASRQNIYHSQQPLIPAYFQSLLPRRVNRIDAETSSA